VPIENNRCPWPSDNPLMIAYHDQEWGVPLHDDHRHFEFLVLDAFQAGLSWQTIINKRENFRRAFNQFDPEKIARYTKRRIEKLCADAGIIRNRLKITSTVSNAQAFLAIQEEFNSFDEYIWQFAEDHQGAKGRPRLNRWKSLRQTPTSTPQSDAMSKALKERGFRFVGTTICYAYMQAAGLVNDHLVNCFRYKQISMLD